MSAALTDTVPGQFMEQLTRNNSQIRRDRALSIAEGARLKYRRKVEDLEVQLNKLKRDRQNMLDLSPTSSHSLVLASDFKEDEFVQRHMDLGIAIRQCEIELEIAQKSFNYLFGDVATAELEPVS